MENFSAILALFEGNSPITSEFPTQRPLTQSFDVLFDMRLNKHLSKPSRRRWFETPSRSLWRHCNVLLCRENILTFYTLGIEEIYVCFCMSSHPLLKMEKSWLKSFATDNNDLPVHDDVTNWEHFLRYWPFVRGIHRSPVNSPHKGQWRGALMFSLICAWINGWVNNGEAGDLRRHRAHYDVTVMCTVNTMSVADGLAQGARLSAAMIFGQHKSEPVREGLPIFYLHCLQHFVA